MNSKPQQHTGWGVGSKPTWETLIFASTLDDILSSSHYHHHLYFQEWRRRYFILKGSKLFFAKNEYSAAHGMMDLASCTTVKSADLKSKKRHSFEISTPETQYLLYADTESQKDDWIGRVGKAIVRCSRTYYDQASTPTQQQASDAAQSEVYQYNEEDDDIYTNDDPNNPYFND